MLYSILAMLNALCFMLPIDPFRFKKFQFRLTRPYVPPYYSYCTFHYLVLSVFFHR